MFQKDQKISEGKTKIIWGVKDNPDLVIIENKNDITAFDDPAFTKQFKSKAENATIVTSNVFKLLKNAGIPVAFQEQISSNEFISPKCEMMPLEVVARRYAVGSFLKRHPELISKENEMPHRFHKLVTEFFLKTTKGELINTNGKKILEGLDPLKGEEDPFILNPLDNEWKLFHSKKPIWEEQANFNKTILMNEILGDDGLEKINEMEEILRKAFLTLEGAWNTLGFRIIDMKIEFGISQNGELMIADVIDNDSWRLKDVDWEELSKEAFRQGEELNEVEKKYEFVASLTKKFRIPKQAVVFWRGSDSDPLPDMEILEKTNGVDIEIIT
ncbi:MAG: phosphoribosylaminoimidazolesuccinocarboxamide synthase, partial [bacterium]|nr:phosphoribosylaminoimidazolesuccinocarboxamide synthase [bacterium]